MTNYNELNKALSGLINGVPYTTANLANASALVFEALDGINWAGFYLAEGQKLILGPFQGKVACIEIPFGKGVCGTAAAENRTVIVENVHEFPGHIACDCASNSEIVIPMYGKSGALIGVLDIDSPMFGRFTAEDKAGLEQFVRILEKNI